MPAKFSELGNLWEFKKYTQFVAFFVMADILLLEGTFNAQKIDFHLFKCRACFLNMPLDSTKFNTRTQQMGYGTWYENILLFPGDIVMTNSKITKIV